MLGAPPFFAALPAVTCGAVAKRIGQLQFANFAIPTLLVRMAMAVANLIAP
jgi:hypothetical protein